MQIEARPNTTRTEAVPAPQAHATTFAPARCCDDSRDEPNTYIKLTRATVRIDALRETGLTGAPTAEPRMYVSRASFANGKWLGHPPC